MGLIENLTVWIWNWFVYYNAIGSLAGCWNIGGWGLIFDDDNGLMMDTCFKLFGGSTVELPVEYSLN